MEKRNKFTIHLTAKKIVVVVVFLQLALLGLIGLDKLGFEVPILRQIIGFVYLTFVPGFLILKLLHINNNNNLEALLLSIGLSISFLMFTGALINSLYPLIGITKPISEIPLIVTISIIVLTLCLMWYLRNRESSSFSSFNTTLFFSSVVPFSLLLPLLAILGASMLRFYNDNIFLLFLLAVISLSPLLVAFNCIPSELYPLIIWSISASLLFHYVLINPVFLDENVFTGVVARLEFWNPSVYSSQASLLAGPIVLPIFSKICHIDIIKSIRILYPLLYSLTPLTIYLIVDKQFNRKIAFFSSFLFMAAFPFYVILSACVRTGMAEFFTSLLLILMLNRKRSRKGIEFLLIIFAFSLITSHYGTSYLLMFALIFVGFFSFLFKKFGYSWEIPISNNFPLLYMILCLSWYMYTAKSFNFNILPKFASHIVSVLQEEGIGAGSYTATVLRKAAPSLSIEITKYLFLFITFFIAIGVLTTLYTHLLKAERKLNDTYLLFSIAFLGILTTTFLPITGFNIGRVYHISLIILSPFALVGFLNIFRAFWKITGETLNLRLEEVTLKLFSILLCTFLIFNSGLFAEIITKGGDYAPSVLISKKRISEEGDINGRAYLYQKLGPSIHDIWSAKWLAKKAEEGKVISVDKLGWEDRLRYLPEFHITNETYKRCSKPIRILEQDRGVSEGYIVLFEYNTIEKKLITGRAVLGYFNTLPLPTVLKHGNKIYTNGGSEIYYR